MISLLSFLALLSIVIVAGGYIWYTKYRTLSEDEYLKTTGDEYVAMTDEQRTKLNKDFDDIIKSKEKIFEGTPKKANPNDPDPVLTDEQKKTAEEMKKLMMHKRTLQHAMV